MEFITNFGESLLQCIKTQGGWEIWSFKCNRIKWKTLTKNNIKAWIIKCKGVKRMLLQLNETLIVLQ